MCVCLCTGAVLWAQTDGFETGSCAPMDCRYLITDYHTLSGP